jgi:hypothetical protein
MIGSQNLFSIVKKRDKPINEVAAIVAQVIPMMTQEDLRQFANFLEAEIKTNNKFKTYWIEVLDLAYQNPEFRKRFEGDDPLTIEKAHQQADKFVARIHMFIEEVREAFFKK